MSSGEEEKGERGEERGGKVVICTSWKRGAGKKNHTAEDIANHYFAAANYFLLLVVRRLCFILSF